MGSRGNIFPKALRRLGNQAIVVFPGGMRIPRPLADRFFTPPKAEFCRK
jgi:hypothetical protein